MDEEELRKFILEIEELNRPSPEDGNVDSPDGFRRFVRRQLTKFSCIPLKAKEEKQENNSAASDIDNTRVQSRPSTSSEEFRENRSALVASEMKAEEVRNSHMNGCYDPTQGPHGDRNGDHHNSGLSKQGAQEDSNVYNFNHQRRGLAVIISNEIFSTYSGQKEDNRPGSTLDMAYLYKAFKNLGFEMLVHRDLRVKEMMEVLREAANTYDHSQTDCFVCVILTHGQEAWLEELYDGMGTRVRHDLLLGVDGRGLKTKTVLEFFNDRHCPCLAGKPRLFFIQACRGNKYDDGQTIQVVIPKNTPGLHRRRYKDAKDEESIVDHTDLKNVQPRQSMSSHVNPPEYHTKLQDSVDTKPEIQLEAGQSGSKGVTDQGDAFFSSVRNVPVNPAPLYKDFLVMYATPPGYYAWRRKTGSWFAQSLGAVLSSKSIGTMSLTRVLTRVGQRVATEYESITPDEMMSDQKKEMTVIETMLVKDIYLARKIQQW